MQQKKQLKELEQRKEKEERLIKTSRAPTPNPVNQNPEQEELENQNLK